MKIRNWSLLITLSGLACFFYFYITPKFLHPAEDAAILFNYAQNLKETGVISYFPGGPAVDGTTDFLFMILVSLGMHFTPDAYTSALGVSAIATMLLLFYLLRSLDTRSLSLQYMALLMVLFSQQIWASVLGYGTMLFGMTIAWAALAYWRGKLFSLAFASTLAILARPDAIITVLPLLAHKIYAEKGSVSRKFGQVFFFFILPVGIYYAGRQLYFGEILPLSFDISTQVQDKVWGLFPINSIHHVKGYAIHFVWPGFIGLGLFMMKQKFRLEPGYYVLMLSMIVLPMLAYLFIRENLDFSRRYFIVPYLGIVFAMSLLIRNHKSIILTIFGLMLIFKVGKTSLEQGASSLNHYYNNVYRIAEKLGELPAGKLATSEAGIITWKSRFETLDLWGLNTPSLTKRLPTAEELKDWNADLIVIHAATEDYIYLDRSEIDTIKTWQNLSFTVCNAASDLEYEFFLVPFDLRKYTSASVESQGLIKSFFKWLSDQQKRPVTNRMELFAVHPESKIKEEIVSILIEHGAQPFEMPKKEFYK